MQKELELWQFIGERLQRNESVMLLVVAESSGSSPGRPGYKMAVGADGALCGSIGGGVMEVNLVEQSRVSLRDAGIGGRGNGGTSVKEQVHQKNSANASGMICSGKQTVVCKRLAPADATVVDSILHSLRVRQPDVMTLTSREFNVGPPKGGTQSDCKFEKSSDADFTYTERLGFQNDLYIIGGGHCALALSELASRLDFRISIFDDRPELNTLEKNSFAHDIIIIDGYDNISGKIPGGPNSYVVVMTLGYASDAIVIRHLIEKDFKYFGVLGSRAKMATLIKALRDEGVPPDRLDRIRTPIGLPINSHTPEEIAVSIAAEIIAVKNAPTKG